MSKIAIALIITIIVIIIAIGVMARKAVASVKAKEVETAKLPATYVATLNYLRSANTWKWNINENVSVANVMLNVAPDNTFNINAVIPTPSYGMPKGFAVNKGEIEVSWDGFLQLPLPTETGSDNFMQINYSTELGVAKVVFVWNGRYGLGTLVKDV
ncbi:hypothetical protein F-VV10_0142 [Faustovirus]|nr:hypothetical protein F-VV10_0142 [Faustovirus]